MNKITILVLICSFTLGSCSIDWTNNKDGRIGELEKRVSELKREKEDDLFKKKQECAKYNEDVVKRIDKNNSDMNKMNYIDLYSEILIEIFYSKKEQSCFAVSDIFEVTKNGEKKERKSIYNILTKEVSIYDKIGSPLFYEKLKELKQE